MERLHRCISCASCSSVSRLWSGSKNSGVQTAQKTVEIPEVNVPAIFIDKFQQSKVYVLKLPQIQSIDERRTFLLCNREDAHSANCAEIAEIPRSRCSSWARLLTCPLWCRQAHDDPQAVVVAAWRCLKVFLLLFSIIFRTRSVEVSIFLPSSTHSCECSRALGVPGSPGGLLQGDPAPQVGATGQ